METREFTAKSVAEAIEQAVLLFGVPQDDLEVEVLSEGRSGMFGLGAEEARIRVVVPNEEEYEDITDDEVTNTLEEIIVNLLELMQVEATIDIQPTDPQQVHDSSEFTVDIAGEDLGILIGRRGETLAALQFMVNLMLNKQLGAPVRITVDVEGYKQRRAASLRSLALRIAERVDSQHQPVTLEAMPPNERRIVHLSLKEHPTVTSQSIGEGDSRKVMIIPKR